MTRFAALSLTAGLLALSTAPALAEQTYLDMSASYTSSDLDGDTLDQYKGHVATELTFGKLTLSGELNGSQLSVDDSDIGVTDFRVLLGYDVTSAFTAFVGTNQTDLEGEKISNTLIGAEFGMNNYAFGFAYADLEIDNTSSDAWQIYADYNTDAYGAYASVVRIEDENFYLAGFERDTSLYDASLDYTSFEDVSLADLNASYYLRPDMRLNGTLGYYDIDNSNITNVGIGAGYQVADNVWLDLNASQLKGEGDTMNSVSLTLSTEIGAPRLRASERIYSFYDLYENLYIGDF
ncbi:hypothetical protein [Celeribacter sp.]|uniref:hypothetical protein n=1 Tax=Celeribacter sp. TaxID=1890673 RepID=UPI003A952CEA